ncbi:MAG: hypothetical protein K2X81_14425, partial [Candidatus Obscuribacterales bacterium]|nr:hypothetical protein [Candidatus Obscuribacterales bacterium]
RMLIGLLLTVCISFRSTAAIAEVDSSVKKVESGSSTQKVESEEFLDSLEKAHFQYFVKHSDEKTGLTMDSSREDTSSSIAAVGFSLTAYTIASKRAYVSRDEARKYTLKTLRTLWSLPQGEGSTGVSGYRGFFYHFLDKKNWQRTWNCELSSIDTALLMAGVLTSCSYFDGDNAEEKEIRDLAKKLFDRVEWDWMYNKDGFISMGWNPEKGKGFLDASWNMFCEGPILILMAAGSPTHPVPAEAWSNYCKKFKLSHNYGRVDNTKVGAVAEERIAFAPTYGYQYPQCWIDFRDIKDATTQKLGFNYFENARRILLAQYDYSIANPMGWKDYGKNCWGLTACDGSGVGKKMYHGKEVEFRGYSARGCPDDFDDGTIAPTAIAASIPYAPELIIPTLQEWRKNRPEIWGDCGFQDAFNPSVDESKPSGWVDPSFLGIDQGPIVIMIENYRSGFLWDLMKHNDVFVNGLKRSGFIGPWLK